MWITDSNLVLSLTWNAHSHQEARKETAGTGRKRPEERTNQSMEYWGYKGSIGEGRWGDRREEEVGEDSQNYSYKKFEWRYPTGVDNANPRGHGG